MPRRKADVPEGDMPWLEGNPEKKLGINVPMPEPLMLQLSWLVENRAIFSKSSFIREVVSRAAEEEVQKLWKVREAVRRMEAEERRSR